MEESLAPVIEYEDFSKIDLRVATILEASPHHDPKVTKLCVLKIDVGEPEPRTICAGIRQHYPELSQLVGRQIIVVANLAPKVLRDVNSHGMLLAASNKVKTELALLSVDKTLPPGTKVG